MIRVLSESEYNGLLGTYNTVHFMGGITGPDKTHIIFIVRDKSYLVSADDTSAIESCEIEQIKETNEYISLYGKEILQEQ